MALLTYSDLQSSILDWLNRPGDTLIPTADLITLFEADASSKLRTHWQETTHTISTVSGTASYALPADFLSLREVSITGIIPIQVLEFFTPSDLDDTYSDNVVERPEGYTLEGFDIRFGPVPNGVYSIRLEYMQTITPLVSSVNWLYSNFPNVYLYGALAEAELFLGSDSSDERFGIFKSRRDEIYQQIIMQDRKYRTGAAPLIMRPANQTP